MNKSRHLPLGLSLAAAMLLAACASAPQPAERPKLIVFMVVDGLPQRQITAYRDQLAPDGLARFLDRGAWFSDSHYGHAFTVTAAGHATMLTGAYPHRTGIIGNDWRDPVTGAEVYCTGDTRFSYIGNTTKPLDGTSPANLKVETVGDVLRRADPRSKVIAISGKDRGAILPAGKTGTAYMYMSQSGQFASTTYYMKQHPAWVDAFNAEKRADRYFGQKWTPLLPGAEPYARSLPDNQPWYNKGGALPMSLGPATATAPTPAFYADLLRSPFADTLSLEFASAAIVGEQLGQDDAPDILSVSLSGHDYVNHAFSAESRLSQDHLLQLDRLFQAFFKDLDAMVGKDNYIAVLTADHGFMPAPENSAAQGRDAGKVNSPQMLVRLNEGLAKKFGEGKWARGYSGSSLLLDKGLIAAKGANADAVADEARALLLAEPGIAAAYTRREFIGGSRAGAPFFEQMEKAWNRDVSGDVQYVLKPYWMFASSSAATHGSPYPYDTNAPVLFWGPKWIRPGRIDTRVEEIDVAPTLAKFLGIAPPATAEGKPLPLF